MYNRLINQPLLELSYQVVFGLVDKGAAEVFGPTGLSAVAAKVGGSLNSMQTGRVYDYALLMVVGVYGLLVVAGAAV